MKQTEKEDDMNTELADAVERAEKVLDSASAILAAMAADGVGSPCSMLSLWLSEEADRLREAADLG